MIRMDLPAPPPEPGRDPPPAPPGLVAPLDAPGFGFSQAFGLSFHTWFVLLPRWLPVMLLLAAPPTAYAHWLLSQPDPDGQGTGWSAYRQIVYAILWLVFGVVAASLMASASVLQRRGAPPTLGAALRMSLPALPQAGLLALIVLLMWMTMVTVIAGYVLATGTTSFSPPLTLLGIVLFVVTCWRMLCWGVALPCLVVERGWVFRAMSRSTSLTRGRRLPLLFAWLLMLAIFYGLDVVLGRTLLAAPDLASSWTEGARAARETLAVRSLWVQMAADTLGTSLLSVSIGVCYVGLRRREEGVEGADLAEAFR